MGPLVNGYSLRICLFGTAFESKCEERADDAHAGNEPEAGHLRPGGVLYESHDVWSGKAAEQAHGVDERQAGSQGGPGEPGRGVGVEDRQQCVEVKGREAETDQSQDGAADGTELGRAAVGVPGQASESFSGQGTPITTG